MRLHVLLLLSLVAAALAVEEGEQVHAAAAQATTAATTAATAAGTSSESEMDSSVAEGLEAEAEAEATAHGEAVAKHTRPINCMDAKVRRFKNKSGTRGSGVYFVQPLDGKPGFDIWCDMRTNGGGWNVFMKRQDGSVDFYRPWSDYKHGFGEPTGEYWLGLNKLNRLSKTMPHKLRIDLTAFDGGKKFGTWRTFMVDDEEHKYTLTARGFRDGGIGNSLSYHSGRPFSTYDRDNDAWANNCASYFHGAWWYGACHHSNLNGRYYRYPGKHPNNYADGVDWLTFRGHFEGAKKAQMKFK